MPIESRCFTVRPAAAPREAFTVLVIDRDVGEAETVCAALREDGHEAEARAYGDDLVELITERNPQILVVRMRVGGGSRSVRAQLRRAFPHIHLISFSGSDHADVVRAQMPAHWTDLYDLSAARMPCPRGFPRAVREVLEDLLSA